MTEGEPEASEHREAVGELLALLALVPLVGGEPAQHEHGEGGDEEDAKGVDVHVGSEGVQEGEERGGGGAGSDVEDGDAQVEPGNGEGEGAGPGGRDGDISDDKVRCAVMNLSQHSVPVAWGCLAPVLSVIHQFEGEVKAQNFGQFQCQVHGKPFKSVVSAQLLE